MLSRVLKNQSVNLMTLFVRNCRLLVARKSLEKKKKKKRRGHPQKNLDSEKKKLRTVAYVQLTKYNRQFL